MLPYVDPKLFNKKNRYKPNEKSDVYSVGVLLWEISSGHPPFEGQYDIGLALEISQGHREEVISGTPEDFVRIYTGKSIT